MYVTLGQMINFNVVGDVKVRCSETLDANYKTPGKYPKENSSSIQHGESLKSRRLSMFQKSLQFDT